ncbi:metallo-phosphoesterase [Companilactobacillus tucceti DSM 20183]|uniref:Metallo-phosphoesterase n=1 Tax=Companilactobacillus tucceti DSM 20183 TaxID=1423811 RepID=A0A0R1IWM0_9LACO|nr:DNA repair exonuclease [Companilactobacillus tucceti]KRK63550.1 metallo-phosphoesterase [Companilactobacillus tucceti DSM 20183]
MKFIHAADLHLDTPFSSISNFSTQLQNKLKLSTYTAAKKVFQTAIDQQVDFVILAGDTFDNTDRSLEAQSFLRDEFEKLNKYGINVYLVYGNHDYFRNNFSVIKFPDNVTVFGKDVTTEEVKVDGLKVGITGFSYYQQHVNHNVVSTYPSHENFDYQIGILHAGVMDSNYAPFKVSDLLSKGYDYWALGHIHKREVLHEFPYIIYPGDTQGRNLNETGIKGFYLLEVQNGLTTTKFVPSSVYIWKSKTINAKVSDTIDSLIVQINDLLKLDDVLVTLTIDNSQNLNGDVIKAIDRGELLQQFKNNNSVLYKINLKYNRKNSQSEVDQKYWDETQSKVFDLDNIKDLDSRLYNNEIIREHINQPDFLLHIQDLVKNTINRKYNGE